VTVLLAAVREMMRPLSTLQSVGLGESRNGVGAFDTGEKAAGGCHVDATVAADVVVVPKPVLEAGTLFLCGFIMFSPRRTLSIRYLISRDQVWFTQLRTA
jgi:hypothetical protein